MRILPNDHNKTRRARASNALCLLSAFVCIIIWAAVARADEVKCAEGAQPVNVSMQQLVKKHHPQLNESQAISISRLYVLAYQQQQVVEDEKTSMQNRDFAARTVQIALRLTAIQLKVFETVPQMESVLKRMRLEEAAGLKQVSAELEPDVRHAARSTLAIGLIWSELSNDIVQLSADRFIVAANTGNITDAVDSAQRTMCTLEAVVDGMAGIAEFFPKAAVLAYAERLYY